MRNVARAPAGIAVGLAAGLVVTLTLPPDGRTGAAAIYLVLVGCVALVLLARALARAAPSQTSEFEGALRAPVVEPQRLRELTRLENDVIHGTETEGDFRRRLRPVLREVAADSLARRHGIDLELDGESARIALGDEAWDVIRADADAVGFRRGLPRVQLRAFIDRLEEL